jgi:membrane-bound lytic murein transglycosylase B
VRFVPVVCLALTAVACANGDGTATTARPTTTAAAATTSIVSTTSTEAGQRGPTTSTPIARSPADVRVPGDARAAARRITAIERALRDPGTPVARLAPLGWEQQVVYRARAAHPRWTVRVLARVPNDVVPVVEANSAANASAASTVEPPLTLPADWRIVSPRPARELLRHYRDAQAATNVPWAYLAAINLVETRMGRIAGASVAGAQGPMQFLPSSWDAFGEGGDVHDPRDAILAAGRYLAAAGAPHDMRAAVFAYNHSDAYVDAITRYASVIAAHPRAYFGYYHWQVSYRTVDGLYLLPEGYPDVPAVRLGA